MKRLANEYSGKLNPEFGVPTIKPSRGDYFDRNNDLFLSDCGTIVYHRDGYKTLGTIYSACSDALIEYNKRHLSTADFNEYYGTESDEELTMLKLCDIQVTCEGSADFVVVL